MQKISLALNVVLLAAVAVLFYLYTSINNKISGTTGEATPVKSTPKLVTDPSKMGNAKIAYINIDSLDMQYEYINDKSKEIKNRQAALEAQYNSMLMKFQEDVAALQQAAQAGIRPEAELKKEEARLQQKQYEIASKEKQMQNLAEEVAATQGDMLKNVSRFIEKFNDGRYDYILAYTSNISSVLYAKPDLEITKEVVDGLNAEYRNSKTEAAAAKKK